MPQDIHKDETIKKTRALMSDMVKRITQEDDTALIQTALTMTVHFFCQSTGWRHEDFVAGLMHFKDQRDPEGPSDA